MMEQKRCSGIIPEGGKKRFMKHPCSAFRRTPDRRTLNYICTMLLMFFGFILSSCGDKPERAVLWTDRPEFAFYAEFFNASQSLYKVEVLYYESPAQRLTETNEYPDIVASGWLGSASTRALFRPLDNLLKEGLDVSSFYSRLLSLGSIDGKQYLLPVSFNIPAMVFSRDLIQPLSNPFIIEMEEIKELSAAYNISANNIYTRMGFSVSSNDDFLYIAANLFGASFREASPLAWNSNALENAITWIQTWISEANTSIQMEDDFAYKYFYDPPDRLVTSGRVLFIYMDSSGFFTLPEEKQSNLDFRWLAVNEMIPLHELSIYYGIHRRTKSVKAAEAFTLWFFSEDTQRLLLEEGKHRRLNETLFGIGGGFSAMRTVTEQVFPLFYHGLLGRMPPENYLSPGNILPRNWMSLKERAILPYLRELVRYPDRDEIRSLERRITEWSRLNRL